MAINTPTPGANIQSTEEEIQRAVALTTMAQQAAGATPSPEARQLGIRMLRGEITIDEAVEVIAERTRRLARSA